MKDLYNKISSSVKCTVMRDEPMARHTTFKIGGPADLLVMPDSPDDLKNILSIVSAEKAPYFVMGNGSNLLVSDSGIRGVVIKIAGNMDKAEFRDNAVAAGAGIYLGKLLNECAAKGLSGLEFFAGIPAALGGAVAMNMGSWSGSISTYIKNVTVLTKSGKVMKVEKKDCGFSYRSSDIAKNGNIVLSVEMGLKKDDPKMIAARQAETVRIKSASQPITYPSAGCVFQNPGTEPAGKLIEKSGLKGEKIGGAQVSEMHANYIVNTGSATAADVMNLINRVKGIVFEKQGIELKLEIKTVGF